MDASGFREAVIKASEYMAFYGKTECTFSEPIEVVGYKGIKKKIIPTISYVEVAEETN